MEDSTPALEILRDPYGPVTRSHRRNLITASVVSLLVTAVGVVPERIEALGIEFTGMNQDALFWVLLGLVTYELFAFLAHSRCETSVAKIRWMLALSEKVYDDKQRSKFESDREQGIIDPAARPPARDPQPWQLILDRWAFRSSVDWIFPVMFGTVAIGFLIYALSIS